MLPTKFQIIQTSGFREDLLEINQSETRISCGGHVFNGSGRNEQYLQRIFHRCCLPSFDSFGQAVSGENICQKSSNQKQKWPVVAMFLTDRDEMSNLYRGPVIDSSYQVSLHLSQRFQRRILKYEKLIDEGRQVMGKVHVAFGKVS